MLRWLSGKSDASNDTTENEASCLFVSSKGLMRLCEVHQPLPNDISQRWSPKALRAHRPGGRIYVHATAMADFVRRGLPKIISPFVLVSGDSVVDVGSDALGVAVYNAIVEHPLLIRWYAQNLAVTHPKVDQIPLGLDYHTISQGREPAWGPIASPRVQEDQLHTTRSLGPPLETRTPLGYSNWHFKLNNGDRAEVIERFPKVSSYFEPKVTERLESWQRNTEYFFTISPRGRGMDCHRTWEAILLGSVPIIPNLPINAQFATLPVVIVDDWADVSSTFLQQKKDHILSESFDFAPVLLETWRRRFHGLDDVPSLRMSYQDFMNLGPKELTF